MKKNSKYLKISHDCHVIIFLFNLFLMLLPFSLLRAESFSNIEGNNNSYFNISDYFKTSQNKNFNNYSNIIYLNENSQSLTLKSNFVSALENESSIIQTFKSFNSKFQDFLNITSDYQNNSRYSFSNTNSSYNQADYDSFLNNDYYNQQTDEYVYNKFSKVNNNNFDFDKIKFAQNLELNNSYASLHHITIKPSFYIENIDSNKKSELANSNNEYINVMTIRQNKRIKFYTKYLIEEHYNSNLSEYVSNYLANSQANNTNSQTINTVNSNAKANIVTVSRNSISPQNYYNMPFTKILLERLQLGAVYNILPSLYGKIIYNFLSNSQKQNSENLENFQIEGVVETKKGITIKAGYKNTLNKYKNISDKNADENKVWTEFIIKF